MPAARLGIGRSRAQAQRSRWTQPEIYRVAELVMLASAALGLAVGLTDWGAKASLETMVVLLLAPVVAGLAVWLKRTEPA